MNKQQVREIIMQELPGILQKDAEMQRFILRLSRRHFADKQETNNHFDRLLDEMRRDREEQSRKWAEHNRREAEKWAENQTAINQMLDSIRESDRKWAENQATINQMLESIRASERRWEEQDREWEEHNKREAEKWEEQNKKWRENQDAINQTLASIRASEHKYESTIGALGARWGLHSEQSFRNGLRGILQESFDVKVLNVIEHDDEGEVFGRPEQIELDIIIKNGLLIICEIKSSMSKAQMYAFERKVKFYEKKHNRKASKALVISPMVDKKAKAVADKLGIQVYSYAQDVDPAIFT